MRSQNINESLTQSELLLSNTTNLIRQQLWQHFTLNSSQMLVHWRFWCLLTIKNFRILTLGSIFLRSYMDELHLWNMATKDLNTPSTLSTHGGPTTSSTSKDFQEEKFMKDLIHLRDSQEAIQGLSGWCIRNRKNNAYKIARCWLKCIKKG